MLRSRIATCSSVLAGVLLIGLLAVPAAAQTEVVDLTGPSPRVNFIDDTGTLQTWRITANDTGFDINDVTGGTRPVHIDPDALTDSLYIKANGYTGLGINNPIYQLHVFDSQGNAPRCAHFQQTKPDGFMLVGFENDAPSSLSNTCGFDFTLKTNTQTRRAIARMVCGLANSTDAQRTGILRFFTVNNALFTEVMRFQGTKVGIGTTNPTQVLQVGNATCNGNTWTDSSSRAVKHDIAELSVEAAREAVMSLTPVTYAYNDQPDDPRVGFIAEDVPELVAMPDRTTLSSMDIVAAMARVVQEQERQLAAQSEELEALRARLSELESRVSP